MVLVTGAQVPVAAVLAPCLSVQLTASLKSPGFCEPASLPVPAVQLPDMALKLSVPILKLRAPRDRIVTGIKGVHIKVLKLHLSTIIGLNICCSN